MSEKPTVKMRVNVAGYGGRAVSIFAAYSPATDILLVAKEGEYEASEREGFLHITNQPRDAYSDSIFTEDDMRAAIDAYFELDALRLLTLGSAVQRLAPSHKIERLGVDDKGMSYRIAPDISSGQVAVMIACLFASRQRAVDMAAEMMDDILGMVTI